MVKTPWFSSPVPFEKAARTGTYKVISDHSTIGIVVTTDGSVTDIPRENYISAEEKEQLCVILKKMRANILDEMELPEDWRHRP